MKSLIKLGTTLVLSQLLFVLQVHADLSGTLKLNPENPEPNSAVSITLESYSFDVDTALITWSIGGKTVLEGEGKDTLSVKTGNVGETIPIMVTARTANGSEITQRISVTPSSVLLLYESPKSYVPKFYEGRSLPSDGGLIHVTAFPALSDNGVMVPPSSLAYSWYVNDVIFKSASGVGKQSATIRLDYLRSVNTIKVVVRTPLGTVSTKKIAISPHTIMPLLYTYDPVLGSDFTRLVEKRYEAVKDFTLSLEPFYLSLEGPKESTFRWYMDGLPTTPLGGRILALHPKENSYGTKLLSIEIAGPDKRIQKASTKVELIFDTRR